MPTGHIGRLSCVGGRLVVYLVFIVSLGGLTITANPTQGDADSSKKKVRERVSAIIHATLKRQEALVDGTRITMALPPAGDDVEEIRRYGDKAVPVLASYLNSSSGREKRLALWLLGALGGQRIIGPLTMIIERDESADFRRTALMLLPAEPRDMVDPILLSAVYKDPDGTVREEAKRILLARQPK